jgi:hypothetical protein
MNSDWQTWAAAGVVAATFAIFVSRAFGKKKRGGSCGSCGSAAAPPIKRP